MKYKVFTVVKVQMLIFWVYMLCSIEDIGDTSTEKMEAIGFSKMLVNSSNITQHINPEVQCLNNINVKKMYIFLEFPISLLFKSIFNILIYIYYFSVN
jgi:hypothetical protein